jgi:SpoVK/Ycf46/Vps4 family AAA+-type ATPase
MSISVDNIIDLKNELNLVVTKRKEAIEKKELLSNQLKTLETNLQKGGDVEALKLLELQIEQTSTLINTTSLQINQQVFDMDALLTQEQHTLFTALQQAFVVDAQFTDVKTNAAINISLVKQDYIQCSHQAIQIKTATNQIIIYPVIVLIQDAQNSFYIVPTASLNLKFNHQQEGIAQTQSTLHIHIPTIYDATFATTNSSALLKIESTANDYLALLNLLNSPGVKGIKKEYYQTIADFGNQHVELIKKISANENFLKHVQSSQSIAINNKYIESLGLIDLLKCFNALAKINDTASNESFSMMYLQSKFNNLSINSYEEIVKLNDANMIKLYTDFVAANQTVLNTKDVIAFELANLLKTFDKELHLQYRSNLYQYASIVMKADGKITKQEEDNLKKIMTTDSEINTINKIIAQEHIVEEKTLEQLIYDLYDLTGLQSVKQEINTLINLIKIQKAREGFDLKNTNMSLHIVFSGNPGTGKTTVARHLAKIYKCLGVLKKGHLVETDRSGMIAEYVGQTAIKVNKLVDSALDGVLFIDEAYALMTDDKDTYGKEAIATLLKRMEDDRERLIVVLAGYSDEMKTLIDSNPGLKSRFNKYIHFSDYTEIELFSIFIGMSRKLNFHLAPGLIEALKGIFSIELAKGEKSFGNGRFVRNLFEKMIENQANRLVYDTTLSKEKLTTLMVADLPSVYLMK